MATVSIIFLFRFTEIFEILDKLTVSRKLLFEFLPTSPDRLKLFEQKLLTAHFFHYRQPESKNVYISHGRQKHSTASRADSA